MKKIFNDRLKSEFNRNVFKIFSGTFLAQVIALAITPILTRIYSPEDFSNLALYSSVVSILSVFVSLKYDKAIMLPKDDKNALSLIVFSLISTLFFGFVFLIIYFFFFDSLTYIFKIDGIEKWLVFVPFSVFVIGIYNILNVWFNRKKEYNKLSINRIFTSFNNGFFKVVFQLAFKLGSFGLVLSEFFAQIIALFFFGKKFFKENWNEIKAINVGDIKGVLKKYSSFPKYSLPADFLGITTRELPIILLSGYYGAGVVGFFMLTKRTLNTPFTLLSTSILEVFKQKAIEDYNKFGNCRLIFVSTLKKLILISIIPFIAIYIFSPFVFSFIFGSDWGMSGIYAQILVVMYFFKFIASPLTYVFYIVDKLNVDLILKILMFLASWLSLYIGFFIYKDASISILFFSMTNAFFYIVYLIFSYNYSKGS